jgi:SpoVK/Ycf46/Vps4 family AAA+-type ATPase
MDSIDIFHKGGSQTQSCPASINSLVTQTNTKMSKKKKKQQKSRSIGVAETNSIKSSSPSPAATKNQNTRSDDDNDIVVVSDIVMLKLVPASSTTLFNTITSNNGTTTTRGNNKSSLKYTPTILLHEADAHRLDVTNGEKVIVLATSTANTTNTNNTVDDPSLLPIIRSGMVQVKIQIKEDETSLMGSPTNKKSVKLRPGTCQLFPSTLAESFWIHSTPPLHLTPTSTCHHFHDDDDNEHFTSIGSHHNTTTTTTTSATTSSLTTPSKTTTTTTASSSKSKSKFSFAIGGGGWNDAMGTSPAATTTPLSTAQSTSRISPLSSTTKQRNITTTSSSSSLLCCLLVTPVESALGDMITSRLCRTAKTMTLLSSLENNDVVAAPTDLTRIGMTTSTNTNTTENPIPTTTTTTTTTTIGPLTHYQQRLVIAHVVGEYVSLDTILPLSMQGRKVKYQVTKIKPVPDVDTTTTITIPRVTTTIGDIDNNNNNNNNDNNNTPELEITANLQQLSLQNDFRTLETSLTRSLLQLFNESTHPPPPQQQQRESLILYRITYETKINLTTTLLGGEKNNDDDDDDDDSSCFNHEIKTRSFHSKPLVTGLDTILQQVQSVLQIPFIHPDLFDDRRRPQQQQQYHRNLRPPKGLLLYGPSGVGKSRLANQVANQMARTLSLHVESVHGTTIQSQTALVGQAEQQLVRIFHNAQQPRPGKKGCLLILDDIHLICPRRQGMDVAADRLASTLLALMDGMESAPPENPTEEYYYYFPMVILAVTTNPDMLDAALRRPGRLDTEIEMSIPDEPSIRAKILRFQLDNFGATTTFPFTETEWLALARLAKGFTGADLTLAAKEAIRKSYYYYVTSSETDSTMDDHSVTLDIMKSAIRSVKPSAIKAVSVEIPHVPWSSIGGMDHVKTQLREAIELPLMHATMFQTLGIRPPRGVLLYGPPGCSKTLMARALATEGHMNFLAVKGPELLSKWLGESERALAALFRRARLASPSVIFFDEVDAIASKRGGGGSGGGERLLSQLLTELDGIHQGNDSSGGGRVVIVCATNRPDLLDSALMRPGRIDRKIYVGVPDDKSREKILELGLQGKTCAADIDIRQLVDDKISGGLSGAELMAACRDAAFLAMEEYEDALEKDDQPTPAQTLEDPIIRMDHLVSTLSAMERQITPEMLDFYASFQGKSTA